MKRIRVALTAVAIIVLAIGGVRARADAALLMEEPYAEFGAFNPTGHAAIYLNHICAASPTRLRPCRQDEPGAVISRYHKIDGYDWLAIPLVPYLYAVERVEDVPVTADATLEKKPVKLLAASGRSSSVHLTTAGSTAFRSRRHQKKMSSLWIASTIAATS